MSVKAKLQHKSVTAIKKKAWEVFSMYVRRRTADWKGEVVCVTCGKRMHWKQAQAGHFIPGRHNSILFDERGCHVQCYRCNVPLKSNPRKYDAFMRQTYGAEVITELEALDAQPKQFTTLELEELIEELKQKLERLE